MFHLQNVGNFARRKHQISVDLVPEAPAQVLLRLAQGKCWKLLRVGKDGGTKEWLITGGTMGYPYCRKPPSMETPREKMRKMGKMGKVLNAVPFSDAAWRLKIAKDQAAGGRSSFRIACRRLSRVTSSPPDFRRSFSVSSNVDLAQQLCARSKMGEKSRGTPKCWVKYVEIRNHGSISRVSEKKTIRLFIKNPQKSSKFMKNPQNSSNITGSQLCEPAKLGHGTSSFPSQQGHEPVRPASSRKKSELQCQKEAATKT